MTGVNKLLCDFLCIFCAFISGKSLCVYLLYMAVVMSKYRRLFGVLNGTRLLHCEEDKHIPLGLRDPNLPSFKFSEISSHKTRESVWMTYKEGVYDVTNFVSKHPGGVDKIMLGAGGAADPFWRLYGQHLHMPHVGRMLESMRIGNVDESDWQNAQTSSPTNIDDPYFVDKSIERHPALAWVSREPANAETPISLIADSFLTPNDLFFVRHHFPVPVLLDDGIEFDNGQDGHAPLRVDDLRKKFQQHSVVATIQCTGNRRTGFHSVKGAPGEVKGLTWGVGAISNARWTGPRLRDVLLHVYGDDIFRKNNAHVHFEGRDTDGSGQFYGVSILLERAMDINSDVILALEMNGEDLPLDHGAPVRVIVPGAAGCRSVKWLKRISLSPNESDAFWQKQDYKSFSPSQGWSGLDFDSAPAVMSTPVQSAITSVSISDDKTYAIVDGYAFSGGGNRIIRVDVSSNGGESWTVADLQSDDEMAAYRQTYSWVLWRAVVENLPPSSTHEFIVKAIDESYNSQPEDPKYIWNVRGILNNSWHRVTHTSDTHTSEASV